MIKNHPMTTVAMPHKSGTLNVTVDRGMVPLLTELWARGMQTTGSCEHIRQGYARIWFKRGQDHGSFLAEVPDAVDAGSLAVDFPREYINRRPDHSK